MRRGEHSHPLKPQSEVARLLSEWQTERVRTGRAANQLPGGDGLDGREMFLDQLEIAPLQALVVGRQW